VCLRQTGRMAMQTLAFAESSHALGDARHDCVSSDAKTTRAVTRRSLAGQRSTLVSRFDERSAGLLSQRLATSCEV